MRYYGLILILLFFGMLGCKWMKNPSQKAHQINLEYELNYPKSFTDHEKDNAGNRAVDIIRKRLERMGVDQASVYRKGANAITVSFSSGEDPDRIHRLLEKSGKLEFRLVDDSLSEKEVSGLVDKAAMDNQIPPGSAAENAQKINAALKDKIPGDSEIVFELVRDPTTKKIAVENPFLLKKKAFLEGDRIKHAEVSISQNMPVVMIKFNEEGKKILADVSAKNIHKRVAIVNDGVISIAPVIKEAIPAGKIEMTLGFGDYQTLIIEAEDLTTVLFSGAYPDFIKLRKN